MVLISGSEKNSKGLDSSIVGQLIVPGDGNPVANNRVWAMDNGAFNGLDAHKLLINISRLQQVRNCKFLAVPDVVGDSKLTLSMFWEWEPLLRGWPLAFVIQDGCRVSDVPWNSIRALFVGGSTEYKLSEEAADCVRFALGCGLWVHWGRVNTLNRIRYIMGIGGHSFDGSRYSRWPSERYEAVYWIHRIRCENAWRLLEKYKRSLTNRKYNES